MQHSSSSGSFVFVCIYVWDTERETLNAWVITWNVSLSFGPEALCVTCSGSIAYLALTVTPIPSNSLAAGVWEDRLSKFQSVSLFLFICNCHFPIYSFYYTPSHLRRGCLFEFPIERSLPFIFLMSKCFWFLFVSLESLGWVSNCFCCTCCLALQRKQDMTRLDLTHQLV